MRLGRLVAAGLVAGAVAGFVGALLRPRHVQAYRSSADRPATDARGDLAEARALAGRSAAAHEGSVSRGPGYAGYALATSAHDESTDAAPVAADGEDVDGVASGPGAVAPDGPGPVGAGTQAADTMGGSGPRTLDVDAVPVASPAVAVSRGANG